MAEREKIISSKIVYEGPIFSVETQDVVLYNGRQSKRDVVRHVPAIAILPFVDDNHIILEKQYRATIGDFILEIPAGKLDDRDFDRPEHAVERELNEELRMTAGSIKRVVGFFETVGFSDAYMHIFIAKNLKPVEVEEQLPRDLGESLDLITVSFDEMKSLFDEGKLNDQKTVLAFLYWSYLRG
ncbi:NUDIX hydrolase [Leuconostoc miyukkimchii]|uniref:NUDIX hydrolase n=1 Tax=Leuconostoc miyukkimchii TaxID=910540 RepID=UPI001C7D9F0B|nr:NUDIX hydrolase [Leuconostoc miyukkimchii]